MLAERLRVLLIEDEPIAARMLKRILARSASPAFDVVHEVTLIEAIARYQADGGFDIAILDLNLPDSAGVDTAARLQKAAPNLPIVVMTGNDDPTTAMLTLEIGAQDYLVKGEISERMVARVIRYAISRKTADLERKSMSDRLTATLVAERERIDQELSVARAMQFDMLPDRRRLADFREMRGLAVGAYFQPSSDIGGDLWGCVEGGDGRSVFYTFDFSGHGVSAALNVFRLHALLSELGERIYDPAATLERLNQTLHGILPRGHYATIFLGIVDPARETLQWSAAAAPPPILFTGSGNAEMLDTRGKPIGLSASARYVNRVVPFPAQSCLFLYSDVMVESLVEDGLPLGEERLAALVGEFRAEDGIDIERLVPRFFDMIGAQIDDDMTALSIASLGTARKVTTLAPAPAPLMLTSRRLDSLADGLAPPYCGFLEITDDGLADVGAACFDAAERGGFCVSLSVAAAWAQSPVDPICTAIRQRLGGEHDWDGVGLCLAEALANAVMHGGLRVKSGLRESRAGLEDYDREVRLGLGDPERAGMRIEVTVVPMEDGAIEIAVHDRGDGYDVAAHLQKATTSGAKHGRGLALIHKIARSVSSRDGGRTLAMIV